MNRLPRSQKHPLLQPTLASKSKNAVPLESFHSNWHKVGTIFKLYTYPILSGCGIVTTKLTFSEMMMAGFADDDSVYRNNLLVVYDSETNHAIQGRTNFMVRALAVETIHESTITLKYPDAPNIIIDLTEVSRSRERIECTLSVFGNLNSAQIKCLDCGQEAADWISKCLSNQNARIAYIVANDMKQSLWDESLYGEQDNKNYRPIAPTYTMIPTASQNEINEKLYKSVSAQIVRPNIVIQTKHFRDMIEWHYIMIGKTILKNINPFTRSEVYHDWETMSTAVLLQMIPLHCDVVISGEIEIGNSVYVKLIDEDEDD